MKITNYSLTKHLYRLDEVLSSLRWAIITHNIHDTAFWTVELCESNFEQECADMLETIWITHIGFGSWFSLRLIQHIYEEGAISQEDLVKITCSLSKRKLTDSTIFHLLLRGATTPSNWRPIFPHTKEYKTIEEAVEDCLNRKKITEAWLLGRSMSIEAQWKMLSALSEKKGRNKAFDILREFRCSVYENLAAVYVLIAIDEITWISSQEPIDNTIPIEIEEAMDDWAIESSMRKRRILQPKPEALLYLTRRSEQSVYETADSEITGNIEDILLKSEYWSSILGSYMLNEKWISDDHKECFYDTFFPDDIPDEWSLSDREKSHGRGLGRIVEQARIRFINATLQRSKSFELWNPQISGYDCSMEWDTLYTELQKIKIELPLKPVRKVFEIA